VKADVSRFKGTGLAMIYETTWRLVTARREGSSAYGRWSQELLTGLAKLPKGVVSRDACADSGGGGW